MPKFRKNNKPPFQRAEEYHQKLNAKWYKNSPKQTEYLNSLLFFMFYIGQITNIPWAKTFITALILSQCLVPAIQAQQHTPALFFKLGDNCDGTITTCISLPESGMHAYKTSDFSGKCSPEENVIRISEILNCEYSGKDPKDNITGSAQQLKEINECFRKGIGHSFFETYVRKNTLVKEVDAKKECPSLNPPHPEEL